MSENICEKVIEAVQRRLAAFPEVERSRDGDSLKIKGSSDGFDIEVVAERAEATLMTYSWHDHFDDPEDAAMIVVWLLSAKGRIETRYRNDRITSSRAQLLHAEGQWKTISTFGLIWLPIGKQSVETRSNSVIPEDRVPMKS